MVQFAMAKLKGHYRVSDQRDQYAQIYPRMDQFPDASRYVHSIYQRDPQQRLAMYAERPPVERGIKLDIPDCYGKVNPETFLD